MGFDGKVFGREIVAAVKDHVAPIIARNEALEARVAALEARAPVPGPKGDTGEPGASVDMVVVRSMVVEAVTALPPAKDGRDGKDGADGKSIEPQEVEALINQKVEARFAEAEDRCVERVADRVIGRISEESSRKLIELVDAWPKPRDGERGEKGEAGENGRDGADGINGKDGVGMSSMLIDREGNLIATMTDGSIRGLGVVIGKDGLPGKDGTDGKDGRDGFSLEDFNAEMMEDGRTVLLTFARGDVSKSVQLRFHIPLDRGVYKSDAAYVQGDGVTYGGSFFIAQKDAPEGKPGSSADWRLSVKHGRDGKDGKDGAKGEKGDQGIRGEIGPRGIVS